MMAAFMPSRFMAWCTSMAPKLSMRAASRMKPQCQKASVRTSRATSPTPTAIAAGRSRPADRFFLGGAAAWSVTSDLEELGFLGLEQLVDLLLVLLGEGVELLLGARASSSPISLSFSSFLMLSTA